MGGQVQGDKALMGGTHEGGHSLMGAPNFDRLYHKLKVLLLTLFSMGGPLWPPYSFSLISPERLELRPSNFLTFSFCLLAIAKI